MKMEIRKIKSDDLPGMALLYKGFWNEDSDLNKMQETLQEFEKCKDHIVYNAILDNKVIGTILGIVCKSLYGTGVPFLVIEDFIVDEEQRRKGVGKKLLAAIENEAKRKGCNQIILVTETERKETQLFYESCGFPHGVNVGYKKKI